MSSKVSGDTECQSCRNDRGHYEVELRWDAVGAKQIQRQEQEADLLIHHCTYIIKSSIARSVKLQQH